MNPTLQPMTEEHASDVITIFNHYIEHSMAAYLETTLPVAAFDTIYQMTDGYPAYVIVDSDTRATIGFAFLHAYKPVPAFGHTAELSYFLAPHATGCGIGAIALAQLEADAREIGITQLLADISSENPASLAFHKKHGFTERGRLHQIGKKHGKPFDVVWMQKSL